MEGQAWRVGLIIGAIGFVALMLVHPTGHDTQQHGDAGEAMRYLNLAVHGGAIACMVLILFGGVGLAARLDLRRPLVLLGLVTLFVGVLATMNAAVLNGFVAPKFLAALAQDKITYREAQMMGSYTWWFNQALANIHMVAFAVVMLLWSLAWPSRAILHLALRAFGVLAGLGLPVVFALGIFTMDVHGAALAALASGAWLLGAALLAGSLPKPEGRT